MLGDSELNHGGSGQEDKRVDGGGKAWVGEGLWTAEEVEER